MKLQAVFDQAFAHAEVSFELYEFLVSLRQLKLRSEWRKNFYDARLAPSWAKKDGLSRLVGQELIIVGTNTSMSSIANKRKQFEESLLRAAIMYSLAAFDKMMHEAVLQNFSQLCKNKTIDELIDFPISSANLACQEGRKRSGKGGKVRKRPGSILKRHASDLLFRETLLSPNRIEEVAKGLGVGRLWSTCASTLEPRKSGEILKLEWSKAYARRNSIVHEVQ